MRVSAGKDGTGDRSYLRRFRRKFGSWHDALDPAAGDSQATDRINPDRTRLRADEVQSLNRDAGVHSVDQEWPFSLPTDVSNESRQPLG